MTQKELAAELGVSQPAIAQLKKQGMPTESLDAARQWRAARLGKQADNKAVPSQQKNGLKRSDKSPPSPPKYKTEPEENISSGAEDFLAAAKAQELPDAASVEEAEAFLADFTATRSYALMMSKKLAAGDLIEDSRKWFAVHLQMSKSYPDLHKKVLAIRLEHGRTVRVEDAVARITPFMHRISQMMDNMPSSLSAKANPQDPDHARDVLDEWVNQVKKALSSPPVLGNAVAP